MCVRTCVRWCVCESIVTLCYIWLASWWSSESSGHVVVGAAADADGDGDEDGDGDGGRRR